MLYKIIHFSIKNKVIIAVFTFVLIVWGLWSALRIPVDALPDVTNNQVQVITRAPTLAAQEVEQFITYPIEKALSNVQGVTEMRSGNWLLRAFSIFGLVTVLSGFALFFISAKRGGKRVIKSVRTA